MTQAYHPKFPQTPTGSLYPINYVVCVVDDLEEGRQALEAFKDAGYDENTVRLMEGQEVLAKIAELEQQKNIFQRFLSSFQDATDDTGTDVFSFEAKQGHHLLFVRACDASLHACSPAEVWQIREIMGRYHGRTIKFFSPWWVEDVHTVKQNKTEKH
ncbi:MAG TPA: hypothetical protein VGD98_10000 [Ktedonobacteraceae bacterium]